MDDEKSACPLPGITVSESNEGKTDEMERGWREDGRGRGPIIAQ